MASLRFHGTLDKECAKCWRSGQHMPLWVPRPANRYSSFTQAWLCVSVIVVGRRPSVVRVVVQRGLEIHSTFASIILYKMQDVSSLQSSIQQSSCARPTNVPNFVSLILRLHRKSPFKFCAKSAQPDWEKGKKRRAEQRP